MPGHILQPSLAEEPLPAFICNRVLAFFVSILELRSHFTYLYWQSSNMGLLLQDHLPCFTLPLVRSFYGPLSPRPAARGHGFLNDVRYDVSDCSPQNILQLKGALRNQGCCM